MTRVAQGAASGTVQDLEQLLCCAMGWKSCWTQSHGQAKVSKAPLRKSVPGWKQDLEYLLFMPGLGIT